MDLGVAMSQSVVEWCREAWAAHGAATVGGSQRDEVADPAERRSHLKWVADTD